MSNTKFVTVFLSAFVLCANAHAELQLPVPDDLKQGMKDTQKALADTADAAKSSVKEITKPLAAKDEAPAAASTSDALPPPVKLQAPVAVAAPAAPVGLQPLPTPSDSSILPLRLSHDPSMLPSFNNAATMKPAITAEEKPAEKKAEKPAAIAVFPPVPSALAGAVPDTSKEVAAKPAEVKAAPVKRAGLGKRTKTANANGKPRYRNVLMPASISKKNYDRFNKHLPTARYENDMTNYLFTAVEQDNVNGLRSMLDYSKRDINTRNYRGETPLIAAVQYHALNVTHLLLGRHADTGVEDENGMTALDYAKQMGVQDMISILEHRTKARVAYHAAKEKVSMSGDTRGNDYASYSPSPIDLAFPTN